MARGSISLALVSLAVAGYAPVIGKALSAEAERVAFKSGDGETELTGYVFRSPTEAGQRPGVVMMHGRGGAYSSNANGRYDASTLSLRHMSWGRTWADAGYVAVLVDSFGPRGYAEGFPRYSYDSRPPELDETTVRPRDAYGALSYLRSRGDVIADRIAIQGWSNGGSATIVAIDKHSLAAQPLSGGGFRAAIVFYPACGLKGTFDGRPFEPYAPAMVFLAGADEEVSPVRCRRLIEASRSETAKTEFVVYPGATHGFDSPARSRQKVEANARASKAARETSLGFLGRNLK